MPGTLQEDIHQIHTIVYTADGAQVHKGSIHASKEIAEKHATRFLRNANSGEDPCDKTQDFFIKRVVP